jgi:hypothetical protein
MTEAKKTSARRSSRRTAGTVPDTDDSKAPVSDDSDKGSEVTKVTLEQDTPDPSETIAEASKGVDFSALSLFVKINWVRENLPKSIVADKTITVGGGYDVMTHAKINTWLRPMLAACGLIDYCSLRKVKVVDTGVEQKNGRKILHYRGKYHYCVINAHDPLQEMRIEVEGWGEDGGDKGPGKAHTYAIKTGRKQLFAIAQGDAEEDRIDDLVQGIGRKAKAVLTPAQFDGLLKKADDLFGDDSDKALKALCASAAFMATDPAQILTEHYDAACTRLERWKESKEKTASKAGDTDDIAQA